MAIHCCHTCVVPHPPTVISSWALIPTDMRKTYGTHRTVLLCQSTTEERWLLGQTVGKSPTGGWAIHDNQTAPPTHSYKNHTWKKWGYRRRILINRHTHIVWRKNIKFGRYVSVSVGDLKTTCFCNSKYISHIKKQTTLGGGFLFATWATPSRIGQPLETSWI